MHFSVNILKSFGDRVSVPMYVLLSLTMTHGRCDDG